jgi:hypothetical protein
MQERTRLVVSCRFLAAQLNDAAAAVSKESRLKQVASRTTTEEVPCGDGGCDLDAVSEKYWRRPGVLEGALSSISRSHAGGGDDAGGDPKLAAIALIMTALERHCQVDNKVMAALSGSYDPITGAWHEGRMDREALNRKFRVHEAYNKVAQIMVYGDVQEYGKKKKVRYDEGDSSEIVLGKPRGGGDDTSGWLVTCLTAIHEKTCRPTELPDYIEVKNHREADLKEYKKNRDHHFGSGAWYV